MSKAILLVDDEPHVIHALSRVLTMTGADTYKVDTCSCGEEALQRLYLDNYDLVVTDLRMPGADGFSLLAHVRDAYPATRTLLITGFGSGEIEAAARTQATAYLAKPFSLDDFVRSVRAVLQDGHRDDGSHPC